MNVKRLRALLVSFGLVAVLPVAFAAMAPACAPVGVDGGDDSADDEESSTTDDEALFLASKYAWPSPQIAVCWVNPQDPAAMGWVKDQIQKTWEAWSAVRFTGWGTCTDADTNSVRIQIGEYWPNSLIGTSAYNQAVSMQLNFTFATFSPDVCQARREYCVRAIAAHEFGHALGFDHEQNRPDTNGRCKADDTGASGDQTIGPWDQHSVMNYCNPNWNGDGNLSPTDIQGVQQVYGQGSAPPPPPMTKKCYALCKNRNAYHEVVGVTSGCAAAAKKYCAASGRGGLKDAKWDTQP